MILNNTHLDLNYQSITVIWGWVNINYAKTWEFTSQQLDEQFGYGELGWLNSCSRFAQGALDPQPENLPVSVRHPLTPEVLWRPLTAQSEL